MHHQGLDDSKTGFDVQVLSHGKWYFTDTPGEKPEEFPTGQIPDRSGDPTTVAEESVYEDSADVEPIECLILCARAYHAEKTISALKHRIGPETTIVLMTPGLGVMENLNQSLFPNLETRPHYILGTMSHGLKQRDYFQVSYTHIGTTVLCPVATSQTPMVDAENDTHWAPSTKYLLRLLTLTPSLVATVDTPTGILQYQLEKLAVTSIIHPLTALSDCQNGELLYVFSASRVMRLLLYEISSVICALPELKGVPGIEHRFGTERLHRLVLHALSRYPGNISRALRDIQQKRPLDTRHFNGWIVARGEELGIKCVLNYMVQHLMFTKHLVHLRRDRGAVPIDLDVDLLMDAETAEDQ